MEEIPQGQPPFIPPAPKDEKWSTAAKVTLVAVGIFVAAELTFFVLLKIPDTNIKIFFTKTLTDFVKDPTKVKLAPWEVVAIATQGVAALSGLVILRGGSRLAYEEYKKDKADKKKIAQQKAQEEATRRAGAETAD